MYLYYVSIYLYTRILKYAKHSSQQSTDYWIHLSFYSHILILHVLQPIQCLLHLYHYSSIFISFDSLQPVCCRSQHHFYIQLSCWHTYIARFFACKYYYLLVYMCVYVYSTLTAYMFHLLDRCKYSLYQYNCYWSPQIKIIIQIRA